MSTLAQDFKFASRLLLKRPGFSLLVILTLALGIGANTAIFTLLDQVLLRQLPVREPSRLVLLDSPGTNRGSIHGAQTFSYPMYTDLRDKSDVFEGLLARYPLSLHLSYQGRTERVSGELVSGNYFDVLGLKPASGRLFTSSDDITPGGHPVALISYGFWQRRFGGDPGVIGRSIRINNREMRLIGVMPAGFHGVDVGAATDVVVPLMMKKAMTPTWDGITERRVLWLNVMGRLKKGFSPAQAEAGINVLFHQILEQELQEMGDAGEYFSQRFLAKHLFLHPGRTGLSQLRRQFSTPLLILMAMVGLVLLIACANVAGLLTARAAARQREMAIRLALGSSRLRLVRQLLVESLLLALAGGVLGLLLALVLGDLLLRSLPFEQITETFSAAPDWRIVTFTGLVSVFSALFFGLVPALQSRRPNLAGTLKNEAGSVTGGSPQARFRRAMVVAQVALSLLLLVGAGLFGRSFYNLSTLDPGFQTGHLLSFSIDPSLNGYEQNRIPQFFEQVREKVYSLPGVQSASMAELPIMVYDHWMSTVVVEGYESSQGEDMNPNVNSVATGFFSTLGIPMLAGRDFSPADTRDAPRVAIINETMSRYFFKDESPIGRRFGFGSGPAEIEIVGLVRDSKTQTPRDEIPRFVYTPFLQSEDLQQMSFYIRLAGEPAATAEGLRRVVEEADPSLPIYNLKTMEVQLEEALFIERLITALSIAFGFLATLLAALGLYGLLAYSVARRTREIGIRMALGAPKTSIIQMVLQEVVVLAIIGLAIGLTGGYLASRFVESQLFGLTPMDPLTLISAVVLLAAVTLAAGYLPARYASRIDPLVALRRE